jgi:hypothetical protein
MDLITFLANNPTTVILGLAGFGLVAFSILIGNHPAPVRISVKVEQKRKR